jgi:L-rhamnose isomerase
MLRESTKFTIIADEWETEGENQFPEFIFSQYEILTMEMGGFPFSETKKAKVSAIYLLSDGTILHNTKPLKRVWN